MFGFGNIKIGKSGHKKSKFVLQHDVNTTSNFGFVQPLMVRELTADSDASLSVESLVRLAPMPCPTFGRVSYKMYNRFVPMTSIYEPFNELMAGMPYNAGNNAYTPTSVPNVTVANLSCWILSQLGDCLTVWYTTDPPSPGTDDYNFDGLTIANQGSSIDWSSQTWSNFLANDMFLSMWPYYNFDSQTLKLQRPAKSSYSTPFNADYVLYQDSEIISSGTATYHLFFCFKYNNKIKNLIKVLQGIGFKMDIYDSTPISFLPLFAYYKAWFDTFEVQRYVTWKSTNCFKLIDNIRENNTVAFSQFQASQMFHDFIMEDIPECYYTDEPDFISSHIATLATSFASSRIDTPDTTMNNINHSSSVGQVSASKLPFLDTEEDDNVFDDVKLQLLHLLTKFVNKNTVIGGKINDYLRAHGLGDNLVGYDSNYIGSSVVKCQISDVMAQSQTLTDNNGVIEGANLGEYAGKGIGYGESNYVKFHTNVPGYWVCLATIVPESKYSQGVDPMLSHISRFQFYNSEFDAKGMQVTPQSALLSCGNVSFENDDWVGYNPFGYIPRYTEYKVSKNLLNGDFSLRSLQDSLLPYVLDKRITETEFTYGSYDENTNTYDDCAINIPSEKAPGEVWRYIGKYKFLGNYNRMFYNTDDGKEDDDSFMSDNFIIHNVMNFNVIAPMKPVSTSFDTDGEDGYVTEVPHS